MRQIKCSGFTGAEMLAGDLVLSDNAPIEQRWKDQANTLDLQQSEVTMFGSMAQYNRSVCHGECESH